MNETTNSDLTAGTSPASTPAPSSLSATSTTAPTGPAIAASPAKSEQLALHGGEPVEPHPPIGADDAAKEPAKEHKCRKPGRTDPALKFAYWNGEELPCSEIGIDLVAELLPITNKVRVLKIAISDGVNVLWVKPSHIFRFLARHLNKRLLFSDGKYANNALCFLLESCRRLTPGQIQTVSVNLIDMPSVVAAVPRKDMEATSPPDAGWSSVEKLMFILRFVTARLSEGDATRTRLMCLYQAARNSPENIDLFVALSAMLSAIALNLARPL